MAVENRHIRAMSGAARGLLASIAAKSSCSRASDDGRPPAPEIALSLEVECLTAAAAFFTRSAQSLSITSQLPRKDASEHPPQPRATGILSLIAANNSAKSASNAADGRVSLIVSKCNSLSPSGGKDPTQVRIGLKADGARPLRRVADLSGVE